MKKLIVTPQGKELVDMTAEEVTQNQADGVAFEAFKQSITQKEADALAGNNKLLELGLTQAQVTAMTGYTPPVSE